MDDDFSAHPATGRVILLNGASSSGKSTLAKAIQKRMETPFLHMASDHEASGLPRRRDADGPFRWWGGYRTTFFDGFHRSIRAYADAGNDLVVDHVLEFREWRAQLLDLLHGVDVFLVGVHCELDELDRRERRRGDRKIGEGRAHVQIDGIHGFGGYDMDVDTTGGDMARIALDVISSWRRRG